MLDSQQLTGQVASHVRAIPELDTTLHPAAATVALGLREAARSEGMDLAIVSGFRSFERQLSIWNAKYRGERALFDRQGNAFDYASLDDRSRVDAILLWSALPGASRHHWGTDIDVIDRAAVPADYRPQLTIEEFGTGGPFLRLSDWLSLNMQRFGFFKPYTVDRGGVQPEPWHLSYAPVAVPALEALTIEVLFAAITVSDMEGREQVLARLPELHERYVRNVG